MQLQTSIVKVRAFARVWFIFINLVNSTLLYKVVSEDNTLFSVLLFVREWLRNWWLNNQLIFNYDLSRITDVLQNKCSKRAFISIVKTAILSEKTAILCRFSVKIRIFANQNLSLTKRMNHLQNKSPVHFQLFHSSLDIYNPSDALSIFTFQRTIAVLVSVYLMVLLDFTPIFLSLREVQKRDRTDYQKINYIVFDYLQNIFMFL